MLTLDGLWLEDVVSHNLDTVQGRKVVDRLGQVLQHKASSEMGILFPELNTLVAMATADINEERLSMMHWALSNAISFLVKEVEIRKPVRGLKTGHDLLQRTKQLWMLG